MMPVEAPYLLTGRVALISGSSRGIGAAMAVDFAEAGARVIVTARQQEKADAVAANIREAGGEAEAYAYDASVPAAGARLVAAIHRDIGQLDILVNNAAILRPHVIAKLSESEFDEIFAVNTRAAVFLCQACRPLLEQSADAAIVNITAAGAHSPMEGIGAYCASKAAMVNFTRTLAREWTASGIRVNALTPGSVATDMILPTDPARRAEFEKNMASQNLMQRLADPVEIARAARFLVSPAASFITGQTLIVDGGLLA
ncbi:MAG: SDR family NAD(P)-dependent oxidoreductase [Gammaproteobacteria bacterium]|nr:SDR family NAD(P)-dependent oxidoreductase [Gammaproteobacteria bacterium]